MVRKPINLTKLHALDALSTLIYGPNGVGKTRLQGDFLAWAQETGRGPTAFIDVANEGGYLSLASLGLATHAESAESPEDLRACIADFRKKGIKAAAFDSLTSLRKEVMYSVLGDRRYPDAKKDGERTKLVWGQTDEMVKALVGEARNAIPWTLWVAPYDRSEDPLGGGRMLTPDLPGKSAVNIAGSFDLVGLMTATLLGPGKVKRIVSFAPRSDAVTRQRFVRAITQDVEIPDGNGGWPRIFAAVEAAMKEG